MAWIINPALGPDSAHQVPASSVRFHVQAGWTLLADADIPQPEAPAGPEPMTIAEAARSRGGGRRRSPPAGGDDDGGPGAGGAAGSDESEGTQS
jgi:hypothetical protein